MIIFKEGKTNWKYIVIVAIFAAIVGGGVLGYQYWAEKKEVVVPETFTPGTVTETEKPSEEVEEVIKKCEGLKEEFKKENLTTIVYVDMECYLIEAIRRENKLICKKAEGDTNKCVCNVLIDFFTNKSEEFKEEFVGDSKKSYYELVRGLFQNSEIDKFSESECPVEIEESIKSCEQLNFQDQRECYFLLALQREQRYICDKIDTTINECQKCVCYSVVDIFKNKTEDLKKEIWGYKTIPETADRIINRVLDNPEIKKTTEEKCPCFRIENIADTLWSIKNEAYSIYMKNIMEDPFSHRGYSFLSCDYNDKLKSICGSLKKETKMEPIIHANEKQYCIYIKLDSETYYCIVEGKGMPTKINPSDYCNDASFICPDSFDYGECKEEKVRGYLSQLRTVAEIYQSNNGSYAGLTIPNDFEVLLKNSAKIYSVQIEPIKGDKYLIYAKLCLKDAFWCVDSTLKMKEVQGESFPKNIYTCP